MPLTERAATSRQRILGAGVGFACAVVVSAAYLAGAFDAFDHRLLDLRFRLRGERDASQKVAMVVIDDATIRAYGRWPLPRDQYAVLLTALEEAGARAVGVDILLPQDMNHDPTHNTLLAFVSGQHPSIVHAVSFLAEGATGSDPPVAGTGLEALRAHGVVGGGAGVPEAASVTLPYEDLARDATALGHITVITDRDGAVRRQPLLIRFEDRVYASLGMRMVGVGAGRSGPPRVWRAGGAMHAGWSRGPEWKLPLDREGSTSIDFAGDRTAFSNTISMIEVLRAYRAGDVARIREFVENRYVLIGLDSRTEVSEDVGTTPFAATTPLVFIHANVLENLLRGRFLTQPPAIAYAGTLALVGAALGWLLAVLPLATAALAAGAFVLLIAALDFMLLAVWAVNVPSLAALVVSPVVYAGVASARYFFVESRARAREEDIREGRVVEQQFLPEALIGRELSRYRVEEKLGHGAMGVVYRAVDPRLEREVAIKVLPGRALADERARRRFRREALALSKLNHPHIAGILDFDSQDGTDFLVMEFVHGSPLNTRVRNSPLSETEAIRIASQVAEALGEAHERGVIHRDLKPENILLTESGSVKVLDFGLALFLAEGASAVTRSQNLTEEGHMVGTLPYMAPEVLRGETANPRSDLYSLGVVMFEMATGRRPFPDDETHELFFTILNQPPPPPRILNGRISRELESTILSLLAKDPDQRPASAAELLRTLRALDSADAGRTRTQTAR